MAPTRRTPGDNAQADALRLLSRRPLSRQELLKKLEGKGHTPKMARRALKRLEAAGYVDDRALARHFIVVRAERMGHGPHRLLADLKRRGVDAAVARAAWEQVVADGEVNPEALLLREVSRRVAAEGGRLDRRALARVYNALFRAGFDAGAIRKRLAPHCVDPEDAQATLPEGTDDGFA